MSTKVRHEMLWMETKLTLKRASRFFQERKPDSQTRYSTSRSKLTSQPSWVIANENATAEWASAILY